jgi:asparagine synthetase B (glutamine-hydrolysing)
MCGISFGKIQENSELETNLSSRGPDYSSTVQLPGSSNWCLRSWVLHLRGIQVQPQPIQDSHGNVLAFNGEVYQYGTENLIPTQNDTIFLSQLLEESNGSEDSIIEIISNLKGEWALAYWVKDRNCLYFGRDYFGRRSLLWYLPQQKSHHFALSSVTDGTGGGRWEEVPCTGIFVIDNLDEPIHVSTYELTFRLKI